MTARERVAAFGSRSTIAGWAAISLSPKSYRSARYRVCRPLDYPARLGLDRGPSLLHRQSPEGELVIYIDEHALSLREFGERCPRSAPGLVPRFPSLPRVNALSPDYSRVILRHNDGPPNHTREVYWRTNWTGWKLIR